MTIQLPFAVGDTVAWLREGKVGRAMMGEVTEVYLSFVKVQVTAVESQRHDRREVGREWAVPFDQLQRPE